jgi:hypothetical protein
MSAFPGGWRALQNNVLCVSFSWSSRSCRSGESGSGRDNSGDLGVGCGHDDQVIIAADKALARALADTVTGTDPAGTALMMARLAGLTGPGWLRLDESVRRTWSRLDEITDWAPLLAGRGTAAGVVAASMWRDGRIREAAVARLALVPGPAAAAALAVRAADWVPQVQASAVAAVSARTMPEDAVGIVPVMLALLHRLRGRQAAAGYLARIADGPAATLQELAAAGHRPVRLWALETLGGRGLLTADALMARALRDPDPVVALWCARQVAAQPGGQREAAPRLLGSARAGVRAFAAGQVPDGLLTRPVLERLLLDRSGSVRAVARWRWTQRWGDPGQVYRAVLGDGGSPPRQIAAALRGLDEDHYEVLPAAAVPFLTHPSPVVRRAAADAVGHHAGLGDIVGLLAPLLHDSSNKVTTAALSHLHGHAIPATTLTGLDAAGTTRARRIALSIRQHQGTWQRIHADLAAINGQDPVIAETARTDLLTWLKDGAATSYGRPSPGQASEIAALLATSTLTSEQRREIAFVAGLRT